MSNTVVEVVLVDGREFFVEDVEVATVWAWQGVWLVKFADTESQFSFGGLDDARKFALDHAKRVDLDSLDWA